MKEIDETRQFETVRRLHATSPEGMELDALKSAAAIAWGWLWHVTTEDDRVKTARHLLGQFLNQDMKRYGIQTAKDEGEHRGRGARKKVNPARPGRTRRWRASAYCRCRS